LAGYKHLPKICAARTSLSVKFIRLERPRPQDALVVDFILVFISLRRPGAFAIRVIDFAVGAVAELVALTTVNDFAPRWRRRREIGHIGSPSKVNPI
jgi:hypothetical protein